MTEEDVSNMFEVNVYGLVNSYTAAAKQMIKQGNGGKLIGCARFPPPLFNPKIFANSFFSSTQHSSLPSFRKMRPLLRLEMGRPRLHPSLRHGVGRTQNNRQRLRTWDRENRYVGYDR